MVVRTRSELRRIDQAQTVHDKRSLELQSLQLWFCFSA